jgi:translocator protein
MRPQDTSKWALVGWVGLCLVAGLLGSLATSSKIGTWYAALMKPWGNPPPWVFGPVWTALYVLMGIAAWLVWKNQDEIGRRQALTLFAFQLVLNALWSVVFFGMENPGAALINIAVLWALILATTFAFRRVSHLAAWLLAPYLAWVTFASYLNCGIWLLNS